MPERNSQNPNSKSFFIYFSLDLHLRPQDRIKVYLDHRNSSAASLAGLIAPCLSGTASETEVHRFFSTLAGGSDGPYNAKSLVTCFAFSRLDGEGTALETEVTVHFNPIGMYAPTAAEARRRIEEYLATTTTADSREAVLTMFRKCVDALGHHEIAAGAEFYQWVGLKLSKSREPDITFYFGPDMFSGAARSA
ncbi:hypothetical protein K438DRAFT_1757818 [Mycena galopus ATCC 62051]|nr:hypothetical protein K438DRAFT_1757818 [Mycena galopus ATCC 62051]